MGSFALESCLCEVSRLVLWSLAIETSQRATVSGRDRSDGYLGGIIFHAAGQSDRYDHGSRLITNWLIQKLKLGWPKWCQIWVVAWLLRDFLGLGLDRAIKKWGDEVEGFLVEIFWISWNSSGSPGKAVTLASGVRHWFLRGQALVPQGWGTCSSKVRNQLFVFRRWFWINSLIHIFVMHINW